MLKQLKTHHRNILQMSFNGISVTEIAEKLDITKGTVYAVVSSELGKAYINGLNDKVQNTTLDVRKELILMNRDALATFKRLLDPEQKAPASVQFNTAKDVLDRSGYKAPDKIDLTFYNKSDDEIDAEIAALESSINKVYVPPEALQPVSGNGSDDLGDTSENVSENNGNAIENNRNAEDLQPELEDAHIDSAEPIDPEIQELLSNETFDPFNTIKDSRIV